MDHKIRDCGKDSIPFRTFYFFISTIVEFPLVSVLSWWVEQIESICVISVETAVSSFYISSLQFKHFNAFLIIKLEMGNLPFVKIKME